MDALTAHIAYTNYGDQRPPLKHLLKIDASLEAENLDDLDLSRVDVLTDSAVVKPEYAEIFLGAAATILQHRIGAMTAHAASADVLSGAVHIKQSAIAESLFKQSLASPWSQSVSGEAVTLDYHAMLQAASRFIQLVGTLDNNVGHLTEFMPLILLARRQNCSGHNTEIGRLALRREERRHKLPKVIPQYVNWDIGISPHNDAASFIDPVYRVQVKSKVPTRDETRSFRLNEVVMLCAKRHGFDCPETILNGCLVEEAIQRPTNESPTPSKKLDCLTLDILDDVREQASLFNHK
jgi:hypothetical protein